jgi:hypothetical protein
MNRASLDVYFFYNQRDATYTMSSLLSAEQFEPIHTSGRQQESMTIPKAAHTVLEDPDDGRKNRPKHVQR